MVVTLLTDFGCQDEFVGVMKGVILGINPSAQIVDLCHEIPPGNVMKAGWVLSWSWRYFPKGTVHVVVVDPGVGSNRRILCLEREGHRFLAPDNGALSRVADEIEHLRLYAVTNRWYALKKIGRTFHGRDLFAPAAAHLSRGVSPRQLGPPVSRLKRLPVSPPLQTANSLKGQVLDIDRFGNAVTNLTEEKIEALRRQGHLKIRVKGSLGDGIQPSYAQVSPGRPLAILGSRGLLEISVNQGSAARRFRLRVGDPVEIRVGR